MNLLELREEIKKTSPQNYLPLFERLILDYGEKTNYRTGTNSHTFVLTLLESFMFGGEARQKKQESTSQVCGHVFRKNEVVYRCNTCGMDETCALCTNCFNPKAHEGHQIFYSMSAGNGRCDCGDPEAWRIPMNCPRHGCTKPKHTVYKEEKVEESEENEKNFVVEEKDDETQKLVSNLPIPEKQTISMMLDFCKKCIVNHDSIRDWSSEQPPQYFNELLTSQEEAVVMIYNDEVHNFEEVIALLTSTTRCDRDQAKQHAENVDSIGRDIIFRHNQARLCLDLCKAIEKTRLRCMVTSEKRTFLENHLPTILVYCINLAKESNVYKRAICEEISKQEENGSFSRLEIFLTQSSRTWKSVRNGIRDLIFGTLLVDQQRFKEILGRCFVANYERLLFDYCLNDPEQELSIVTVSLQLFTTPTVVNYLIARENLFFIILDTIIKFFGVDSLTPYGPININNKNPQNEHALSMIYDLKYILSRHKVQEMISADMSYLEKFLQLLTLVQGMDPQERYFDKHIEFENNVWVKSFTISMSLAKIISTFASCFPINNPKGISCKQAILYVVNHIIKLQKAISKADPSERYELLKTNFGEYLILNRQFTSMNVFSFHNPLHWFLAALIKNTQIENIIEEILGDHSIEEILWLIEIPLKEFVVNSEIASGLWKRNGASISYQSLHYKSNSFRENAYERNLLLLQIGLTILGPSHFFSILFNKFSLIGWLSPNLSLPFDEYNASFMIEEQYTLIMALINERWLVGESNEKEKLRQHIINILCAGPTTHSDIVRKVEHERSEDPILDNILEEITETKYAKNGEKLFSLKEEHYSKFDPFSFNFRKADREKAEEHLSKYLTKEKNPSHQLRKLVPIKPAFQAINNTFNTPIFCSMVFYGLWHNTTVFHDIIPSKIINPTVADISIRLIEYAIANSDFYQAPFFHNAMNMKHSIGEGEGKTLFELLVEIKKTTLPIIVDRVLSAILFRFGIQSQDNMEVDPQQSIDYEKKKLAQEAREKMVLKMKQQQESFMKNLNDDQDEMDASEPCVFCKNEIKKGEEHGSFGYFQKSSIFKYSSEPIKVSQNITRYEYTGLDQLIEMKEADSESKLFQPSSSNLIGYNISTCGHLIHLSCFLKFERGIRNRRNLFLCPFCRTIGNLYFPKSKTEFTLSEESYDDFDVWLKGLPNYIQDTPTDEQRERSSSGIFSVSKMKGFLSKLGSRAQGSGETGLSTSPSSLSTSPPSSFILANDAPKIRRLDLGGISIKLDSDSIAYLHNTLAKFNKQFSIDMLLETYIYTLKMTEISQRGKPSEFGVFLDKLAKQDKENLKDISSLIMSLANQQTSENKKHGWIFMRKMIWCMLKDDDLGNMYKEMMESHDVVLREDSIASMVKLLCLFPPSSSGDLRYIGRLFYMVEVVKVTLGLLISGEFAYDSPEPSEPSDDEEKWLKGLLEFASDHALRLPLKTKNMNIKLFLQELKCHLLPFLRQAAIAMHTQFGISAKSEDDEDMDDLEGEYSEFKKLISYLNFPPLYELIVLTNPNHSTLISGWCFMYHTSEKKTSTVNSIYFSPLLNRVTPFELFPLPKSYDQILLNSTDLTCPKTKSPRFEPAMCLLCGVYLCSQTTCCTVSSGTTQMGTCFYHAEKEHGGTCLFLYIKQCCILVLKDYNGNFTTSPYFDIHGESDSGLKRGRPLFLNMKRYQQLREEWVGHKLQSYLANWVDSQSPNLEWTAF